MGDPAGVIRGRPRRPSATQGRLERRPEQHHQPQSTAARWPRTAPRVLSAVIDSYKDFLDETYRNVSDDTLDTDHQRPRRAAKATWRPRRRRTASSVQKSPLIWSRARMASTSSKSAWPSMEAAPVGPADAPAPRLRGRLKTIEEAVDKKRPRDEVLALAAAPEPAEERPGRQAGTGSTAGRPAGAAAAPGAELARGLRRGPSAGAGGRANDRTGFANYPQPPE